MRSVEYFLMTLFTPHERVCLAKTTYDTALIVIDFAILNANKANYVSLNPLLGKRADANVTSYRNILLEFDKGGVEQQIKFVNDSKLPYTTMTFSGNKSIHVVITLEIPCSTRAEYDVLVDALYSKFPEVDKSCRNPSRFTRLPGSFRSDTGKMQHSIKILSPVKKEELLKWIGPIEPVEYLPLKERNVSGTVTSGTSRFLGGEYTEGNWNNELFLAAIDLFRCCRDESKVLELLREVTGTLDRADLRTIASARKASQKD